MNQTRPQYLTTIAIILVVLAAFLAGFQLNANADGARPVWASLLAPDPTTGTTLDDTVSLKPVELFESALQRLRHDYVTPITNTDELTYAAIRGMLLPLKDPYTRFMDPKEYKEFRSDNQGRFAGIGATLHMVEVPALESKPGQGTLAPVTCPVCNTVITDVKHYRVMIADTLPGSPAKKADLQPGDIILKVNGEVTDGLLVSDVADKIRGPVDTEVKLTLQRKGAEKPVEVTLTRAEIEVPAVETKTLDDNIGYLRIYSFNEKTFAETEAALKSFNKQNVRGMVLDLRGNPGGLLMECIRVASMFLPTDEKLIVSTKTRTSKEDYNRMGVPVYDSKPLVVLVNKGSASASEILSGALKDYKRGDIIGESTFGKALVQSVIELRDGSAMAITTAHYYTPSGFDVGTKGVPPDINVELDKDVQMISEKDNQAQAALRILKEKIAKAE